MLKNFQMFDSMSLLRNRLNEIGLQPFDCGGDGDCYFRSVSHQLFGFSGNHLQIRLAGVAYLRNHPEEFIEFVNGQSWLQYLSDMSRQGNWCDGLVVQGVADAYNLKIHIIESAQGFCETTIIEPHYMQEPYTPIFIGHIDEYHYVSTIAANTCSSCDTVSEVFDCCTNSNSDEFLRINETSSDLFGILEHSTTDINSDKLSDKVKYSGYHSSQFMEGKKGRDRKENSELIKKKTDEQSMCYKLKRNNYMSEFMKTKRAKKRQQNDELIKTMDDKLLSHKLKRNKYMSEFMKTKRARKKEEKSEFIKSKTGQQSIDDKLSHKLKINNYMCDFMNTKRVKKKEEKSVSIKRKTGKQSIDNKLSYKLNTNDYMFVFMKRKTAKQKGEKNESIERKTAEDCELIKRRRIEKIVDFIKSKRAEINRECNFEKKETVKNFEARKRRMHKSQFVRNVEKCSSRLRKRSNHADNISKITRESEQKRSKGDNCKILKLIRTFQSSIECGPEYICTCCDQLWYKSSVRKCNDKMYAKCNADIVSACFTGVKSVHNSEWICRTCEFNLKSGKLPACAKANKMFFPEKPEVLNLTALEERLVSPRICFMQLRELPRGGQLTIHGSVVNVPTDVNSTINALPRPINECQTIPIKLKRRLSYKHHYQFEKVRPRKVLDAARYLVATSKLFQDEGIEVRDSWLESISSNDDEDWLEFVEHENGLSTDDNMCATNNCENCHKTESCLKDKSACSSEKDDWAEVEERPSGVTDTLLQEPETNENFEEIMTFAPGEGNRPLGIFCDKHSEFLSFPTIFCGKSRTENKERVVPVHYSTICKWELRNRDRRVSQCIPNIFYKLKKLQIKQILDSSSLCLRKCKRRGKKYTAGELKCPENVNNLIHLDEGFRVLRNLRGSPPYFEKCRKDLFAMIRQLGNPTWFCSFSAAETRWSHLLKILGRLAENKDYTDNDISEMSWHKKSELIQKDPVTCARNFEYMVQRLIFDVLKSEVMPIGEIDDYFYRVEFQQRGSPHIHALIWIKNAPQYEVDSDDKIENFVDRYLTCVKNVSCTMTDLVNLQLHRHAKTCKKKEQKICRFNFPLFPMRRTMIVNRLNVDSLSEDQLKVVKENCDKVKNLLDEMKYGENISFDDFLEKLDLSEKQYITAVRFSLNRDTLLLKRDPSEIRINNYNSTLLQIWQANMDIQYVLDPYACAVYILSYITKGQRGMSKLLEAASEEAKLGDKGIKDRVRFIGNKFINAIEVSAQEAVYLVLQMPLRRASRDFQFINTSDPDERLFLLKSMDKIHELPDSSSDIESDNLIKRYQRRPRQLEQLCLADFCSLFNCVKSKIEINNESKRRNLTTTDFPAETNFDDNIDDDVSNENKEEGCEEFYMKGGMKLVRRIKAKIIRSVRFNKKKDPENYCREQLMLYIPWRNESKDLMGNCQTFQDRFEQLKDVILQRRQRYEKNGEVLEKAIEDLEYKDSDKLDIVAPSAQHSNEQDLSQGTQYSELYGCFNPGVQKNHQQYNLLSDAGIFPTSNDNEKLAINRMDDCRYRQLVQSLNKKQKEFFYHVLNCLKINHEEQLTLFLSGGAGVGKTTLTHCLYEALVRYFDSKPGENPDEIKVLKVAPTGKASYIIRGNTIHRVFRVPVNSGFHFSKLRCDDLNTIRTELRKLRVVFIDEVSMVGSRLFNFLNLRLQEIMGSTKIFGGISIITVGDLFQLKPVFDKWIFLNSDEGYGPLALNIWENYFKMFELTEIMRQKDDRSFAELLNRIREGNHTNEDVDVLKTRVCNHACKTSHCLRRLTHIVPTNESVTAYNNVNFLNSLSDKVHIKAIDIVIGDISDDLKEKMKQKIPNDPSKTMGLFHLLPVAVGEKYDFTVNVSVLDGLTNGTECIVEKIDYRVLRSSRPSIIWVSCEESDVGKNCRKKYSYLYNETILRKWIPVLEITRQFKIYRRNNIEIMRRQFPLRAASAKTVHRCQGDTVNCAVIDFPTSRREHMHYVGLSRVRNMSSLHILNLNEKKITVSPNVVKEMARLRTKGMLKICLPFLYLKSNSTLKILFQNVRSLHLHFQDVACDYNVRSADVNIFVETALCYRDNDNDYCLENFKMYRNDWSDSDVRSPYGTVVYLKDELYSFSRLSKCNYNNVEFTLAVVNTCSIKNLHIVGVYRSKTKVTMQKFIDALNYLHEHVIVEKNIPVIIVGDFNVNLMDQSSDERVIRRKLIEERGYKQLVNDYTTDYLTQIDHIYINNLDFVESAGVLESYYSDHKPVFVSLFSKNLQFN